MFKKNLNSRQMILADGLVQWRVPALSGGVDVRSCGNQRRDFLNIPTTRSYVERTLTK